VTVSASLQDVTDREDGASKIAEDHDPGALIGRLDRRAHSVLVGAEAAVGQPARGLDAYVGTGHLRGERSQALRKVRAVRYDYDPDHGPLLLHPSSG